MAEVTCVIPTIGRTCLLRSIASVYRQSVATKIVVVLDNPDATDFVQAAIRKFPGAELRVTQGHAGANYARNLGACDASTPWISYLDDDDWWEPGKIEAQLIAVRHSNQSRTLSAGSFYFHRGQRAHRVPAQIFDPAVEDAASYVARRSRLRFGDNALQSSSLMISRELHRSVLWDESLPRHDDWDYVARALRHSGANFVWQDSPLVHVQQGSQHSISRSFDWRGSLQYLERHGQYMTERAAADFIAAHVLRGELAERNWPSAWRTAKQLLARPPHAAAMVVALSGLVTAADPRGMH